MKFFKRGQKGFTLIELLIVVAILGVLAAVIIPNVGRFLGRGQEEARRTEKRNLESAVINLMVENELSNIPNPVLPTGNATNDMTAFPDATSVAAGADKLNDPTDTPYQAGDQDGYVLYQHDKTADNGTTVLHNYVNFSSTTYFYCVDADGTVHQYVDAAKTGGEYTD